MGDNKIVKDGMQVMRAIYYGDREMLENALENNINIDATNEFGETALMYACNSGIEEIARKIVDCGANVNLQNKMGNTPIIYACDSGNKSIVEYLMEHGADVNHRAYDGKTALICACNRCKILLVKYLVEHGADVNCETRDGDTPLIRACDKCNFELVKYLVEQGAQINAQNIVFETPLMRALRHGVTDENTKIVTYLVDNGADLDLINNNVELRDFMKRVMAKEPKIGTIIAMRKEGLNGVRRFLEKFVENIRTECMVFLARSNTVKKLKEDNDVLEKQLKKALMDNLKLIDPKKEIESIIKNRLQDHNKNKHDSDNSTITSNCGEHGKDNCSVVNGNNVQKDNARIVENMGRTARRSAHVKKHNEVRTKYDKTQKKQDARGKKHNGNKNDDKKNNENLSLVDIMNEKKFVSSTIPNVSIVSKIKTWEKNGREKTGRSK